MRSVLRQLLLEHTGSCVDAYIHSISSSRLLACVAFSEGPIERVGQCVFTQIGEDLIIDFERGEVC